jgi:hypothetical protein
MTRETAKKLLPVIEAYANGEIIEYGSAGFNRWTEVEFATFDEKFDYRIKPKPLELWLNVYPNRVTGVHPSQESAYQNCLPGGRTVHMREVVSP